MLSRYVPRVCRSVCAINPCRWMSSKRNVPMFWHRPETWDPFSDRFFSKPFDSHFPDMARIMDSFLQRPHYLQDYVRPSNMADAWNKTEIAQVKYDKNKLEIKMDVSIYKPEELNITIADDRLVVKGKHEQKADNHGYVAREFTREFVIPENIDQDGITSTISEEGMLTIQGRVKGAEEAKERVIEIQKENKDKE